MTFLSGRRLISACIVSAALGAAAIAPGSASATPDLLKQCEGAAIKGHGSTFQAPILETWAKKFKESKNLLACAGVTGQGSGGTPLVEYLTTLKSDKGSGACLNGYGAEVPEAEKVDFGEFGFCGTDEAPSPQQKFEIEKRQKGGEANSLETIPVAQGSVAILVHLPEHCLASSEVETSAAKFTKFGRLVLEDSVVNGIYTGSITTWKKLIEEQKTGKDAIVCKGGSEVGGKVLTGPEEEEETIVPVVRLDKSGTTHIFKSFLEQVSPEPNEYKMEEYPEEVPGSGKKTGCGKVLPEETLPWSTVAALCQNQRWPTAAKVKRPTETGNPGVVKLVDTEPSSIGYADLAVARKEGFFSNAADKGGENKKGSATKVGEQNTRFWAEVQNTAVPSAAGYADPSSNGDVTAAKQSNCKNTVYSNEAGRKFPPESTREPWNQAKAELVQNKTYAICGLTYDLALRQYKFYPETTKAEATTVENFLLWAVNTKAEGGQAYVTNSDYEKVTSTILKEDEKGIKEIGFEIP